MRWSFLNACVYAKYKINLAWPELQVTFYLRRTKTNSLAPKLFNSDQNVLEKEQYHLNIFEKYHYRPKHIIKNRFSTCLFGYFK